MIARDTIVKIANNELRLRAVEILESLRRRCPDDKMHIEIENGLPLIVVEGKQLIEKEYGTENKPSEPFVRDVLKGGL